jgi:hypothetical protein
VSDIEAVLGAGPTDRVALYDGALRTWAEGMKVFDEKRTDPGKVAEIVVRALTVHNPKRRYSVGQQAFILLRSHESRRLQNAPLLRKPFGHPHQENGIIVFVLSDDVSRLHPHISKEHRVLVKSQCKNQRENFCILVCHFDI